MKGTNEIYDDLKEQEMAEKTPDAKIITLVLHPEKLLDLNKASIKNLASHVRYDIREGHVDGLDALIAAKKLEKLGNEIVEMIKAEVYAKPYCAKGEILKRHGAEVEQAEVGVEWDFSNVGDVVLDRLEVTLKEAKTAVDDRKNYLKVITTISEQVDTETGETYFVNPPIKKSTLGYRVTLK